MGVRQTLGEFLDDHEEAHAVGAGLGLGFAAVASDELRLLAIVATIGAEAVERSRRPRASRTQNLRNDIRREPHYFLGAVVVGALLGAAVRAL